MRGRGLTGRDCEVRGFEDDGIDSLVVYGLDTASLQGNLTHDRTISGSEHMEVI